MLMRKLHLALLGLAIAAASVGAFAVQAWACVHC